MTSVSYGKHIHMKASRRIQHTRASKSPPCELVLLTECGPENIQRKKRRWVQIDSTNPHQPSQRDRGSLETTALLISNLSINFSSLQRYSNPWLAVHCAVHSSDWSVIGGLVFFYWLDGRSDQGNQDTPEQTNQPSISPWLLIKWKLVSCVCHTPFLCHLSG